MLGKANGEDHNPPIVMPKGVHAQAYVSSLATCRMLLMCILFLVGCEEPLNMNSNPLAAPAGRCWFTATPHHPPPTLPLPRSRPRRGSGECPRPQRLERAAKAYAATALHVQRHQGRHMRTEKQSR